MHLAKITRRLLSRASLANFEIPNTARAKQGIRLGLEMLEHRTVPATATVFGGQLVITPDTSGESIELSSPSIGMIGVTSNGTALFGSPFAISSFTNILVNGLGHIPNEAFTFGAAAVLTQPELSGIQQIAVQTGTAVGTAVFYNFFDATPVGSATTPSMFFMTQLGAAPGVVTYGAPEAGVSVVQFQNQPASGNIVDLDMESATSQSRTFLDFGSLTSAVNVNLSVTTGGELASYANNTTTLFDGDAATIYGARGGMGDNNFIGNPALDQYFIGGLGNNNIDVTGASFTDQVNAIYDFSPSLAGSLQTSGYLSGTYSWTSNPSVVLDLSIVNLTNFDALAASYKTFLTGKGANTEPAALFALFGPFDIGENTPLTVAPDGTVTGETNITDPVPALTYNISVNTGTANADVFGYDNVALTAVGHGGNNDFESASGSLASFLSGGNGTCSLQGYAGDTVIAGTGNTAITFFSTNAGPALITTLETGDGTGTVAAGSLYETVDVGLGTYDLNGLLNSPTIILIFNDTTTLSGANISADTSQIPPEVQASSR